ncbi:sigma-70 family RNA polymerase sigma factor [Streptomyces sp. WAC06614]|uniref:sigma-70 family RNA polymerase sigma factor n=1 Tax=Streptomyces sp. WAC06614 TaxID=2487416 RepID=UPI00163CDA36|nr:sigma-70 family RNA polymerase sigma factor [Streptomyces sp. WAC06614]
MGTTDTVHSTLDEETLADLHRVHGVQLMRALMRITRGDRGRAEDIYQETLMRAWQNPEVFAEGPEKARPWLFTVARRIAIDHHRMRAARVQEVTDAVGEDRPDHRDPFDEVLAARDIMALLAKIPAHQREVVVELHLRGRSLAETAELLGVPLGTVKSRNHHAIRRLRPVMEASARATAV